MNARQLRIELLKPSATNRCFWGALALSFAVLRAAGQLAPERTVVELDRLQGYWEGEGAGGKCSITIKGNTLHYRAGTNWHETTFTLPAGTVPQQLHATIRNSWPPAKDAVGQVVRAIIKIEDGTLTLATFNNAEEPPKTFDALPEKYVVKKVQPKQEHTEPPKRK